MPTTINGIGTQYYGKQNLERRSASCQHCGTYGELLTYDTRLWFCFIFIPVIPLGRKRILDQCSACTRHGSLDAGEWEKLRTQAIREATAAYEASPDDAEKAVALHATLASGGERDGANRFAEMMMKQFADSADVQIYLGGCFEESNQMELSNRCFHRAYEIDPNDHAARQVSAVALLREGQIDAARKRIVEAKQSGQPIDPSITFSIADALNSSNDPQGAAELLKAIGKQSPELQTDKTFRKLAKQVEQATGAESGSLAPPQSFFQKPAFWWGLAATAVLAGIVARDVYLANNQPLYVVNGLSTPFTVEIDGGAPLNVRPGSWTKTTTAGGAHQAVITEPAELAGEAEFAIESDRMNRWFNSPVHVLDPTHSAVVLWEETIFSDRQVNPNDIGFEMNTGQLVSSFDDADYHFSEFPNQLKVNDSTSQVRKSRVGLLEDIGPVDLALNDPAWIKDPASLDFMESHLLYAEETRQLLTLYTSTALDHDAIDRCFAYLESHLQESPTDVDWHRTFQSVAEWKGEDLRLRYDASVAAKPDDADLHYLRGRLETQSRAARSFFEKAIANNPEHAPSLAALAFSATAAGDFAAALNLVQRALSADENVANASELREQLLIALGRQAELERGLTEEIKQPPFNFGATQSMITSQASRDEPGRAQSTHEEFVSALRESWPEDPHELAKRSEVHLRICTGDFDAAKSTSQSFSDEQRRNLRLMQCALLRGVPDEAAALVDSLPEASRGFTSIWISLVHLTQGNVAASDRQRLVAIEQLSQHGGESAAIARLLDDRQDPGALAAEAYGLDVAGEEKAALLLLMADRAGKNRQRLVELAERLSLLPSDYQSLLQAAIVAQTK